MPRAHEDHLTALRIKLERRGDRISDGLDAIERGQVPADPLWRAVAEISKALGPEKVRRELVE